MTSTLPPPLDSFTSLLDAIPCGAFLVDRRGVVRYANERLCRMMVRDHESVVGQTVTSFYTDEPSRDFLRKRLEAFNAPYEGEFQLPRADGEMLPVILSGRPLGDRPPQSDYRLVTLIDISAQKKAAADQQEEMQTIARLSDTVLEQALELKRYSEKLEERVRERTRELHEANMEAIYMLAIASEAKDQDTGAHVRRIEALSREIARAMGLKDSEAERIGYSAILHDVGKMMIPDHILKKPGPLDGEERDAMRLHPVAGERILSRKPFFELARQIARSHHENWDGSGYPDGLSGDRIPISARIVHLADVYDALTSARAYKPPWSPDDAFRAIEEGAGRLFDPEVVRAFRSLTNSGRILTLRS